MTDRPSRLPLAFATHEIEDIAKAARLGFDGVQLAVGAFGDPLAQMPDEARLDRARRLCEESEVAIVALGFHELPRHEPVSVAQVHDAFERVIEIAAALGVKTIGAMPGFDGDRTWEENLDIWAHRFAPVAECAERTGVNIAFEPFVGFWGKPPYKPVNFAGTPDTWDAWFGLIDSDALGIEFDPSHLFWQGIDHIRALREYSARVYHVHAKDTEILGERRYRAGATNDVYRFRIPGYGGIDWTDLVSTLVEVGYEGPITIEHEDTIFGYAPDVGQRDESLYDEGLIRGWHTLAPLLHPQVRA